MSARALFLVAMLGTFALSGCIGGGDDPPGTGGDDPNVPPTAEPTAQTGSLQGEVLSNSLDPLIGAVIAVAQGASIIQDTTAGSGGRYTFNGLEPGAYQVQVNAVGYHSQARTVQVAANQVARSSFQLDPVTAADIGAPYMVPLEFAGFMSCGAGMAILPKDNPAYPSGINPRIVPCGTVDPNDEFLFRFDLKPGLVGIVGGVAWEPVGGVSGTELNINIEQDGCGATCADEDTYIETQGPPDILFTLTDENIPEKWAFSNLNETLTVQIRMFPAATTTPNVIYQQPYDIYLELYYNQAPPADRNPIPDA